MRTKEPLIEAKRVKADEFYTPIELIEKEVPYYKDSLKGKVVYCNCDDYRVSAFYTYFVSHFEDYDLEAVISTSYDPDGYGTYAIYDGEEHVSQLEDNGDFRGDCCKEILRTSDVVVTNPPFSLFREYVKQLMDYGKKFIIMGNMNAITYKEIFPYIKENKLWWGASITSGDRKFYVPDNYPLEAAGCGIDENGRRFIRVKGVRWWTNLTNTKRNTPLDLFKKYSIEYKEYPKYDNYDAININKTSDIPMDYDGVMGVPITFFDKYCPKQFEIVDARDYAYNDKQKNKSTYLIKDADGSINGKPTYARICIRRKLF